MGNDVTNTIKLLLVDDHGMVRECLRSHLERHRHLKVVGDAAHGDEAMAKIETLLPDMVLLDVDIPTAIAFSTLERIQSQWPSIKVIVITSQKNPEYVLKSFRHGAVGYVLQEGSSQELLSAIEAVQLGKSYINPILAGEVVNAKRLGDLNTRQVVNNLSNREREVLSRIARGQTSKDIAREFQVSVRTVQTHRERIMRKLNIHTVAGLTRYALTHAIDDTPTLSHPVGALTR
jgi:two-component system nitrate/nitrite response regulator NarL